MLWAIDVGNTQTVVGVWDGSAWIGSWRFQTDRGRTEDEFAASVSGLCEAADVPFRADQVIVASVVPQTDLMLTWFCQRYFGLDPVFLRYGDQVGLPVDYDPPHAVGADRVANALGALAVRKAPLIVVDFGTATTLDVVDEDGRYVGGAILPGVVVAIESLVGKTAKLPGFALAAPERAVGKTTVESLQSGSVLAYAYGIDGLVKQTKDELGGQVAVVSTGGIGQVFQDLCHQIDEHLPTLTLDGLVVAAERIGSARN